MQKSYSLFPYCFKNVACIPHAISAFLLSSADSATTICGLTLYTQLESFNSIIINYFKSSKSLRNSKIATIDNESNHIFVTEF